MAEEQQLWLGRDGEKFGPYSDAMVRQWLDEGKVSWHMLAWRTGMAEWLPLSQVLAGAPEVLGPPGPPGAFSVNEGRHRLPDPPSLHWFLIILLSLVTLGIFGYVWPFIQAAWIRRIDPASKATRWLIVSVICTALTWVAQIASLSVIFSSGGHPPANGMMSLLFFPLGIVNLVFYYMAVFSMADSMRRQLPGYGLTPRIGGVTLFFFTTLYLQGQMTWVSHWKRDGVIRADAPKAIFWCLWLIFPATIGILAAIAIPAYQNYLVRAQVAEGVTVAADAKNAVATYYSRYGVLPTDNAKAGLPAPDAMHGVYVSSVAVVGGRVGVVYDNAATNRVIRGKVLVFTPVTGQGALTWRCSEGSDIPPQNLPAACR